MALGTTLLLISMLQTPADTVIVRPADIAIEVDATAQLTATVRGIQGSVRWFSSDATVVRVDRAGNLVALRPGTVRVIAAVGAVTGEATVTVPPLPPARVSVTPPGDIAAGASALAEVTVFNRVGDPIPGFDVAFASSNTDVAAVDRTGRVFGRRAGRAELVVTAGPASGTAEIRVTDRTLGEVRLVAGGERAGGPAPESARTGDVVRFRIESAAGAPAPAWSVDGAGAQIEAEGPDGVFVAEEPGAYVVTARVGESLVRTHLLQVTERHRAAEVELVGRGAVDTHHSGDVWVFEGVDGRDYAYLGTFYHDWMKVWDVTDPAAPTLTDSIQLDARRINDVKIHPNNRIAVVTREGASNRRNGIVILDLSVPAHPTIVSEFTETVTGGVHNVWIEPNDLVYAVHNGTSDLHIIDIADPRAAREVGRWGLDKASNFKTLHDVIVQEGYAYLSYWDDGIVTLDVGAGTHGGTPTAPAFVSRLAYPAGNTHTAWRHGRYLFVGDEIYPPNWNADVPIDARGYIHVIDMTDPDRPVEVAKYEVPEAGAHNVWVEGDRLYIGYYQAGLRVVDISGELRGDLYRQGREIAVYKTTDEHTTVPNWPMTWGAQLFKGRIFSSDLNSGLWITRLNERALVP